MFTAVEPGAFCFCLFFFLVLRTGHRAFATLGKHCHQPTPTALPPAPLPISCLLSWCLQPKSVYFLTLFSSSQVSLSLLRDSQFLVFLSSSASGQKGVQVPVPQPTTPT